MINVEVEDSGVSGHPGTRFPANSCCCSLAGASSSPLTEFSKLAMHFASLPHDRWIQRILTQTGSVHGSERFTIERGVKQGDVISPILFNAGLEHAMRKWKAKLFHHGVQLGHGNRLTNIRYADDLMLFATSSKDLIYMLETLIPELAACGLQLNSAKTKILTTSPLNTSEFVDVCELARHYGADESQNGDCKHFVPNGGLGR